MERLEERKNGPPIFQPSSYIYGSTGYFSQPSNPTVFLSFSVLFINLVQNVSDFVFTEKEVVVPFAFPLFCLKRFNLTK